MTAIIDPKTIGRGSRRHVRSLTGYTPEKDETGKEKWPRGDEQVWKTAMRGLDSGEHAFKLIAVTANEV